MATDSTGLEPALLRIRQVADRLQVSVSTVRRLIGAGRLAVVNIGSGTYKIYRVPVADLEAFIDERKQPSNSGGS